ncbi:hypothetical protein [Chondrinema litorale]|uniref:hypothetical protein n=1 Tax=Chondrinema litorale TaxID=2994555 RepID=UPI002542855A|nr:hypothetical protein [Chondrinema litorale]UZR99105.1 hypothetical protein OQ292_35130 [Chondrinema litorale]
MITINNGIAIVIMPENGIFKTASTIDDKIAFDIYSVKNTDINQINLDSLISIKFDLTNLKVDFKKDDKSTINFTY